VSPRKAAVVVVGGGPAGAAAARTLAIAGLDVVLLRAPGRAARPPVESLVPAGRVLLEELGCWDAFAAGGHVRSVGNSSVWGDPTPRDTDFIHSPYGSGWHVDRELFERTLLDAAAAAGARLRTGRLLSLEREREGWRLTVDGLGHLRCGWIVDCTGRSRRVARTLGVPRRYDDRLVAVYVRAKTGGSADADTRTLVEAVRDGWFHTALLPSGERAVGFFTDAGSAALARARSLHGFAELVETTTEVAARLEAHGYSLVTQPRTTDARSSRLARFHGDGWLAAGDAAATFDPLAAQGIYFALYSGLAAAKAVAASDLDRYEEAIGRVYDRFLVNRLAVYGRERRWPSSPFWRQRRGGPVQRATSKPYTSSDVAGAAAVSAARSAV
jgi:flavin-dependent dehydrogenase